MEKEIYLFDGTAPGSEAVTVKEAVIDEGSYEGKTSRYVTGVVRPSILPYIPQEPNGTAVLVIPGGGYNKLMLDKEGIDAALWLNSFGITAFVLKYRMPSDGHKNAIDVPLQDAQRALRLIRSSSDKYNINPDKIGAMGFSAGGHLTSVLGTCFDMNVYAPLDKIDEVSARPDFIAMAYPGISIKCWQLDGLKFPPRTPKFPDYYEKYCTDRMVTPNTPQAFIVVADDDPKTPTEHSVSFYLALRKANVPAELHIFKEGDHGFALRGAKGPIAVWTDLFMSWVKTII